MVSVSYGFAIARTGSASSRADSVAIARTGFFLIATTGSFVITETGFFLLAATGSFGIAGASCFVVAGPISFLVSCSALARLNVEGASDCACAAALEMARSDIVANGKESRRRTEASYAGNCDVGQAFF